MVYHWLGNVTVIPFIISDHLHQFGHLGGSSKHHRFVMYLFWLSAFQQFGMKEMVTFSRRFSG